MLRLFKNINNHIGKRYYCNISISNNAHNISSKHLNLEYLNNSNNKILEFFNRQEQLQQKQQTDIANVDRRGKQDINTSKSLKIEGYYLNSIIPVIKNENERFNFTIIPQLYDLVVLYNEFTSTIEFGYVHEMNDKVLSFFTSDSKMAKVSKHSNVLAVFPLYRIKKSVVDSNGDTQTTYPLLMEFVDYVTEFLGKRKEAEVIIPKLTLAVTTITTELNNLSSVSEDVKPPDDRKFDFIPNSHLEELKNHYKDNIDLLDILAYHSNPKKKNDKDPLQTAFSDLLELVEEFQKQFSTAHQSKRENIMNEFNKPYIVDGQHLGTSFYNRRFQWSASDQKHYDEIPVLTGARTWSKSIKFTDQWSELFHLFTFYYFISTKKEFHFIERNYFTVLTAHNNMSAMEYKIITQPSTDKTIFIKYCQKLLLDKGTNRRFKPDKKLLTNPTVPLLDHLDHALTPTIKHSIKSYIDMMYRYYYLIDNPFHQSSQVLYRHLIKQIGCSHTDQLAELLTLLGKLDKKHSFSESKSKQIHNFFMNESKFISNQQKPSPIQPTPMNALENRKIITETSFAIDSVKTKDVDDSIGVIQEGDGSKWIIVHIADVSKLTLDNQTVNQWALLKSSSIYFPTETHFMLPPSLTQHFSLEPGKSNYCLSFKFKVSDNGDIVDYQIFPSIVENVIKTNYGQVDDYFNGIDSVNYSVESKEKLKFLHETAKKLHTKRSIKSLPLDLPGYEISVDPTSGKINVEHGLTSYTSASQLIVSEMMITTGYVASLFSKTNNLSIPYRNQVVPNGIEEFKNSVWDQYHPLALTFYIKNFYEKADVSLQCQGHYSLGIDNYCWTTSPIRRYPDILVHSQIKNFLARNQPIYQNGYLESIIPIINRNINRIKNIQRQSKFDWTHKYIHQEGANKVYDAILLNDQHDVTYSTKSQYKYKFYLIGLGVTVPVYSLLPLKETSKIYQLKTFKSPYDDFRYHFALNTTI
ncbi:hypothetical protein DLAC_09862 [Tieghemostelium lacteum]|uniref:RNB domain-containing protein n=1 Tax=Tieghemostelium lacteum TaxID=361077 RepID=A0A151Z7E5_TIELA|nr:hypothetical protein DLAC_09862 [Tieghemostelium lacteum]|eukprot:KYQ89886.1 hypothetical protein DLAC_09862 [Tieghemostelium lacteum]